MGFFKAIKGAKELGDYHGGRPSLKDAFKDISSLADDRGQGEVLRNGIPTKAVVQGFPTPVAGDRFAMQIPLDVYPPEGGAPYPVNYVFPTARMKAAITAGMEVPVKVDPNDPQRVAVQWDAQKAEIAAAGGDMAAVQAGLAATYGGAADAAMRAHMAGDSGGGAGAGTGGDVVQKIEQLAKLRDSGAITESEFAAKKAELLDRM